jgi:RNA polymerase sigma-70 factor (ECF subfamily)
MVKLLKDAEHAEQDEKSLLERASRGDEQAVRTLFRTHSERLYRHAARILGKDDPDVEDVVQQAFLAALDGAARFDGRSSVSTWLFGITTRRALDAARARWRRRRWDRVLEAVGFGDGAGRPDHAMSAGQEAEAVLAELSPEQRTVFVLHDVEGYTFAEISGLTDTGISTLHGRLATARRKVETHMEGGRRG